MRYSFVITLDTSKTPENSRTIFTKTDPVAARSGGHEPTHTMDESPADDGSATLAHWGIPD